MGDTVSVLSGMRFQDGRYSISSVLVRCEVSGLTVPNRTAEIGRGVLAGLLFSPLTISGVLIMPVF